MHKLETHYISDALHRSTRVMKCWKKIWKTSKSAWNIHNFTLFTLICSTPCQWLLKYMLEGWAGASWRSSPDMHNFFMERQTTMFQLPTIYICEQALLCRSVSNPWSMKRQRKKKEKTEKRMENLSGKMKNTQDHGCLHDKTKAHCFNF